MVRKRSTRPIRREGLDKKAKQTGDDQQNQTDAKETVGKTNRTVKKWLKSNRYLGNSSRKQTDGKEMVNKTKQRVTRLLSKPGSKETVTKPSKTVGMV